MISRLQSLLGLSSSAGLERLLARFASGALVLEVVGAFVAFAVQWLLARLLGADGLGIYLLCLSWIRLLALPAKLGFEQASVRLVAAYESCGDLGLLRGFLVRSRQLVLVAALLLSAAFYLAGRLLVSEGDPELARALTWAALVLPLFAFVDLNAAVLRGFKRVFWGVGSQRVLRPILMLTLVLVLARRLTPDLAVALQGLTVVVTLAITSLAVRAARPAALVETPAEHDTREWLSVSLPLLLVTGFFVVLRQTDIIMVGSMLGTAPAGIYGSAVRVAALVHFGLTAVNAGLAPIVSQLHTQGRSDELQGVVSLGARLIFGFTLVVGAGVIVGAPWVLRIFGEEFVVGTTALRVLIASQVVNSLAGPVGLLMAMTGHQREAARVIGGTAALNVLLNAALIPPFGIVGAAVATTLSTVVWNVTLVWRVRKLLGINSLVRLRSAARAR